MLFLGGAGRMPEDANTWSKKYSALDPPPWKRGNVPFPCRKPRRTGAIFSILLNSGCGIFELTLSSVNLTRINKAKTLSISSGFRAAKVPSEFI